MIRYTTYLVMAACGMAVPAAMAQQPGEAPQRQSGHRQYGGDDGTGGQGGYGTGGGAGGGDSASVAASGAGSAARALEVIFNASGVPHKNGQVAWPSGL